MIILMFGSKDPAPGRACSLGSVFGAVGVSQIVKLTILYIGGIYISILICRKIVPAKIIICKP
jgi:hypothetical protein